jgi:hypothetical protein
MMKFILIIWYTVAQPQIVQMPYESKQACENAGKAWDQELHLGPETHFTCLPAPVG